jgi:hypothetical protein
VEADMLIHFVMEQQNVVIVTNGIIMRENNISELTHFVQKSF